MFYIHYQYYCILLVYISAAIDSIYKFNKQIYMKNLYVLMLMAMFFIFYGNVYSQKHRPIAVNDTINVNQFDTVRFNPLLNDYDPDGDLFNLYIARVQNFQSNYFYINYKNNTLAIYPNNKYFYGQLILYYVIREINDLSQKDTAFIFINFLRVPDNAYDSLNINNISAGINANNVLFNDFWKAQFRVPSMKAVNAIFSSSLWIGGYDEDSILYIGQAEYYPNDLNAYVPGPVAKNHDKNYHSRYDRVWKLDKYDLVKNYLGRNDTSYKVPAKIQSWPAHGDTINGEAAMLAPFIDFNSNGIYEPVKGDCPCLYGDQSIFALFSRDSIYDTLSEFHKMGLEFYLYAFGFKNGLDTALNNSIFLRYHIKNRSIHHYHDVYAGLWTDFDLGYANDDMSGCDTMLNMFYSYNSSDFDSLYGVHSPASGVVFLNQPMTNYICYNNDFSPTGNPFENIHYYNYMKSLVHSGAPFLYKKKPVKFLYPGNPKDTSEFVMTKLAFYPGDARGVGSSGKFSLAPGEEKVFDFAVVWSQDASNSNLDNVDLLKYHAKRIHDFYNSKVINCYDPRSGTGFNDSRIKENVLVYPNPASEKVFVSLPVDLQSETRLTLIDLNGKIVLEKVIHTGVTTTIQVSNLQQGVYLIHLSGTKFNQWLKLIKE